MSHCSARLVGACLLGTAIITLGCGKSIKKVDISGKITYQGKPIKNGTLTLIGIDQQIVTANIEDGAFSVPLIPVGKVLVGVSSPSKSEQQYTQARGAAGVRGGPPPGAGGGPQSKGEDDPPGWFPIPKDKANPDTSGISFEVESGKKEYTIDIP